MGDGDLTTYGKCFEDLDEKDGISKKPLSLENQIATDEKGRRRFHGAFTGGFSAGYFNTVGSIQGWIPSTFKSSRSARVGKDDTQKGFRPEDYMDAEDLGEYGIAPRTVRTTTTFQDKDDGDQRSERSSDRKQRLAWEHTELAVEADRLASLIKPVSDSIGVQLLKKMGWRPGKGIGPLVSKKRKLEDVQFVSENFKFAPVDIDLHVFEVKADIHGLGYKGLDVAEHLLSESSLVKESALKTEKRQKKGIQGQAFGVGAFEEDDDDIYVVDDLTKYYFALDSRSSLALEGSKESVDHDFVAARSLLPPRKYFPPPKISRDFVPKCPFAGYQSTSAPKYGSPHNLPSHPTHRAAILDDGSTSIWSLVSPMDRARVERSAASRSTDSAARSSRFDRRSPRRKSAPSSRFDESTCFKDDPIKRERFMSFLAYIKRGLGPPKPPSLTDWEWESERREFEQILPQQYADVVSRIKENEKSGSFSRPLCRPDLARSVQKIISSKFAKAALDDDDEDTCGKPAIVDQDKIKAVQMKMFGPMTHEKHEWHPHRNLCKRFNLPDPYPSSDVCGVPYFQKSTKSQKSAQADIFGGSLSFTEDEVGTELVDVEKDECVTSKSSAAISDGISHKHSLVEKAIKTELSEQTRVTVPSDGNAAEIELKTTLPSFEEAPRPPMDLFTAIFAESDQSSSDDEVVQEKESTTHNHQVPKSTSSVRLTNVDNKPEHSKSNIPRAATDEKRTEDTSMVTLSSVKRADELYGPALPSDIGDVDILYEVVRQSSKKHKKHHKHKKAKKSRTKKKSKKRRRNSKSSSNSTDSDNSST